MADLLRKPIGKSGKVHDITAKDAGWGYVGFGLYRLKAGEVIGELGERMNVFERIAPHCVYIPNDADWSATATTDLTLAVCTAPGIWGARGANHRAYRHHPGRTWQGGNTRYIHNIGMENRDVADSLLVTEVFTPSGNWSSYPPHRHDEESSPI